MLEKSLYVGFVSDVREIVAIGTILARNYGKIKLNGSNGYAVHGKDRDSRKEKISEI
jgi:hypothetical protein